MNLSETQCYFIANALRVAVEQYGKDAITLEGQGLKTQFESYARTAESYAEAFENAREVIIK